MTDWTNGYMADIGYTYGYYNELNPLKIRLALLNQGLVCPQIMTACELGFGQGVSINIHAAAGTIKWYGTDFTPSQAGFAQELASASGSDAKIYDDSFLDFANRTDLPDFDFIAMHGIWSWISDENRNVIVEFIRKKLKVGGVLYISYNTLPGWAAFAPIRQLLNEHAEAMGVNGDGIIRKIDGAINFVDDLLKTKPAYSRANPLVNDRMDKLKSNNRNYLAHEYFNRDWEPMHFSKVTNRLEMAKINYACSANYLDAVDAINLKPDQQAMLNGIKDATFKQSVRDFMVNQHFRKDYWIKGPRKLSTLKRSELIRQEQIMLVNPASDIKLKISGVAGEAILQEHIYQPIIDILSNHMPIRLGEIESKLKNIDLNQLLQAVLVLSGLGHVCPVQLASNHVQECTFKLNNAIINGSTGESELNYLASPVSGGGHSVNRIDKIFILAIQSGLDKSEDLAKFALRNLEIVNQKLLVNGVRLDDPQDNLKELNERAQYFIKNNLEIFKSLKII
jgi:SAM-dependent methyltransferase